MSAGLLATKGVKESLESHPDPLGLIADLQSKGIKGPLTVDMIPKTNTVPNPGRVIAPILENETENISVRNNMPDWRREDFPMDAVDAMMDIQVHYDITGNSTTEGKMGDINACFNDRLAQIRKMIVKNSKLPRKYSEVARLQRESSRYQGYENMAVAIGLVNEPRYTKNGHLMWNLEDETGEMNCLLTIRKGDDRDRMHEQIVEAGLMPDDVLGVSGSFSQTGDIFYVDDLFFPMKDKHEKQSADIGVSVASVSYTHLTLPTILLV